MGEFEKRNGYRVYNGYDLIQTIDGWTAYKHGVAVAVAHTLDRIKAIIDVVGRAA